MKYTGIISALTDYPGITPPIAPLTPPEDGQRFEPEGGQQDVADS